MARTDSGGLMYLAATFFVIGMVGCGQRPPAASMPTSAAYAGKAGIRLQAEERSDRAAASTPLPPDDMAAQKMVGAAPGMQAYQRRAPYEAQGQPQWWANKPAGRPAGPMASAGNAPSAVATPAPVVNPNLYLSSGYVGGNGARDRVEQLIREGVVVDGRRVKLDTFARRYTQSFPMPVTDALGLTVDTERTQIMEEGGHTYLQVGLQARRGELPRRPPLNIALVIDRSGSMGSEQKLEHVRDAALALVNRLRADDTFSLIAFDDRAEVLVPARRNAASDAVRARILAITPGGGTNIYEGLTFGYEQAAKYANHENVSLVILLSDGEVTSGINDPSAFQSIASRNADRDIQLTSVGVGVEFNEELMLGMARAGRGNYHFLKDGADTRTVFARELDELTHVVAKAVRVRIRLAPGVGFVRALGQETLDDRQTRQVRAEEKRVDRHVYEELGIAANRQSDREEPGIKVLIPNFYRGDSHVILLEVAVPAGRGNRRIADVSLKYKDLASRTNHEVTAVAGVDYTRDRQEMVASIKRSVKKNLLGFQTGEALAQASRLVEQGRYADAVRTIDERMVVLGVAAREWNDRELDGDGRLLDRYKAVLSQVARAGQSTNADLGAYLQRSLSYAGYRMAP